MPGITISLKVVVSNSHYRIIVLKEYDFILVPKLLCI